MHMYMYVCMCIYMCRGAGTREQGREHRNKRGWPTGGMLSLIPEFDICFTCTYIYIYIYTNMYVCICMYMCVYEYI